MVRKIQWFEKFSNAILHNGYIQFKTDHSLFTKQDGNSFLAILVYIKDIIIAGNDSLHCQALKDFLQSYFHIKNLGTLKYFLGLGVAQSSSGIFIFQWKYTLDILQESGMLGTKPIDFSMQ